jgi:ubiquinone/menaquinone biosynthesis C-methylase UbiE/uncharacterized membrane protein YbhN (UPF0104 family)
MAWVVLLAAAAAVLAVGIAATVILFTRLGGWPEAPGRGFWIGLLAACGLTVAGVGLRSLRWVFLLRRADTRIPIRDAYIGYFSGLSLLFAPLLVGEIAVRAYVLRARGGVPVQTTIVVNIWERLLDLSALAGIALAAGLGAGDVRGWTWTLAAASGVALVPGVRRVALRAITGAADPIARAVDEHGPSRPYPRLAGTRTWIASLLTSVVAWLLPSLGLWVLARAAVAPTPGIAAGIHTYAASTTMSSLALAPGGILIAGRHMLAALTAHGLADDAAALVVFGVRLATAGLSVALGVLFVLLHVRSASAASTTHFDDIADAYDVQIPESRRHALLLRKTELMKQVVETMAPGRQGIDVGCGQGAYVARMRQLGFDVVGIDASAGQVRLAARNVGGEGIVTLGSVLEIPAEDGTFDFLYIINVLHHLTSLDEQRRAFAELFRVLKPGGVLFVHEINTRNVLFRFYMGYLFPSLNCIDEGVERWLLPHRLAHYTDRPVVDVQYFTFLPDFVPAGIVRLLGPLERLLEKSAARVYSAHYMAVLRK